MQDNQMMVQQVFIYFGGVGQDVMCEVTFNKSLEIQRLDLLGLNLL